MIKSNEFRIGNWVKQDITDPKIYQIGELQEIVPMLNAEPIPLTREILKRISDAGLLKRRPMKLGNYEYLFINDLWLEDERSFLHIPRLDDWIGTIIKRVEFVHELQNWYFMFAGKELEITKEMLEQEEKQRTESQDSNYVFLKDYVNSPEGKKYLKDSIEKLRIEAAIEKASKLNSNYIPYQLCPKCEGSGTMSPFGFTCDACNGAKIIPMHPIKK